MAMLNMIGGNPQTGAILNNLFGGVLNGLFKAPQKDLVKGRVVIAKADGTVDYPDATTAGAKGPFGLLAQNVVAPNVNTHALDSVSHVARYGEAVGLYHGGGVFETNQTATAVNVGDVLYAEPDTGKLTTDNGGDSRTPIAIAETAAAAGELVRIRLLI